jgi:hypothetical protein
MPCDTEFRTTVFLHRVVVLWVALCVHSGRCHIAYDYLVVDLVLPSVELLLQGVFVCPFLVVVLWAAPGVHSGRRHIACDYRVVNLVLQSVELLLQDVALFGTLRSFGKVSMRVLWPDALSVEPDLAVDHVVVLGHTRMFRVFGLVLSCPY